MGKFEFKQSGDGYSFHLKASNGQIIGSSQVYRTKDTCKAGIESVKNNCAAAVEDQTVNGYEQLKHPKYEVYLDKAGEYRFRLKASNGENIFSGQGYTSKAACLNGIASIGANAPEAETVELV